jgi:hypothetical protein
VPSYSDRIGQALELLADGLGPFVEEEFQRTHGAEWPDVLRRGSVQVPSESGETSSGGTRLEWDAHLILLVMWDRWNEVFRTRLGFTERSLVSELREVRNRWAHQAEFTFDDAYRCLDSVERLLTATRSERAHRDEQFSQLAEWKSEMLRARVEEETTFALRRWSMGQKRLRSLVVYVLCAVLLVTVTLLNFGVNAWPIAATIVVTFGYLGWRLYTETASIIGPHECARCGRIVYSEPCPYCRPSGAGASAGS